MDELPRCRRATWPEIDRWAGAIAQQVEAAGARPETIVGLTRGGWVPSRLLADRLGVARLVSLRAQHWGVTATKNGKAELTEGLSGAVRGQKVLVVDDITDTGESLRLAADHVRTAGAGRLETAALLHIDHATFRPTYVAEEIGRAHWVWVVFPWNYWEDLSSLAVRAGGDGSDPEAVARTLKARCGLDVPVADVAKALASGAARGPPAT